VHVSIVLFNIQTNTNRVPTKYLDIIQVSTMRIPISLLRVLSFSSFSSLPHHTTHLTLHLSEWKTS